MANPPPDSARHEEFVALFVRHEQAIYSFVLAMMPSAADAQDVVQDASLAMWRRFEQYQSGTNFRNWAFQVAKLTAFNHLVKRRRDRHRFGEELVKMLAERGEQQADNLEAQRQVLEHCIAKLGAKEREVLAGCYKEGTTVKQYAHDAGRTAAAVYKQINRIRIVLLQCVQRTLGMEVAR